jgi:rhamnosyltransferase
MRPVEWRRDYAFPADWTAAALDALALPLAAMRRSIWEQHRFQTDTWGSEDTEWALGEAERTSGRIRAEAVVMHSHNYTLRQLYGRRFVEGEADALHPSGHPGVSSFLARTARSIGRDVLFHLREADFVGLGNVPLLRLLYYWAYYRGHKLGKGASERMIGIPASAKSRSEALRWLTLQRHFASSRTDRGLQD